MQSPADVSVPLSGPTRARLEAAASARGQTVQELVGGVVERFLDAQCGPGPALAAVRSAIEGAGPVLRQRGIAGVWLFGSVARDQAAADSDVDLLVEFVPGAQVSLVGLASLRAELSDLLGWRADVMEWAALRPDVRAAAEQDAVRVL